MNDLEKVVEALSTFVNCGGRPDEFAALVMREHRTLQQLMFGCFMECVQAWARDEFGHDLRNEFTYLKSREIIDYFTQANPFGFSLIPPFI